MNTNESNDYDYEREQLAATTLERLAKLWSKPLTGLTKRISAASRLCLDQSIAVGKLAGLHDPDDLVSNCIEMAIEGARQHREQSPGPELRALAEALATYDDEAVTYVVEWVHEMTGGDCAS